MISAHHFDIVMSDLETDYEGQVTRKSQVVASEKCLELAKGFVVDFVEWMQDEKYEKAPNGFYSNRPPEAGVQTWFNLTELVDKYLNKQ